MRELPCFGFCEEEHITVKWMTDQAYRRLMRWGLHPFDVIYVLYHSRMRRRTGARFCSLRPRDVPPDDRALEWVRRLVGTTLLVSADGTVLLTLYKNRPPGRAIRRQATYCRPRLRTSRLLVAPTV